MDFEDHLTEFVTELEDRDGDFVLGVEAHRFAERMRDEHPDQVNQWLHDRYESTVHREIGDRLRGHRQRVMTPSSRFGATVRSGGSLDAFRLRYVVDASNHQRAVADMTGPDHLYVAGAYEARGNRQLLLAACHRAVAKRVGQKRTADVLTETQYQAIFATIASSGTAAA